MRFSALAFAVGITVVQSLLPSSSTMPPTIALASCIAQDDAGAQKCANLLPDGFAEYTRTGQLDTLRKFVSEIATSSLVAKAQRRSSLKCKLPWEGRRLQVRYEAPEAMALFPINGTGLRDLVTGVFNVEADGGCWEAKYGVKIDRNEDWKRVLQFMAVRSEPKTASSGEPVRIGSWRTFAIYERLVDGVKQLKLQELKNGRYIKCAHSSTEKPEDVFVAFTGCRNGEKFHALAAAKTVRGISRVDSLVRLFNDGDTEIRRLIDADTFTDPVWGYCGGLGCCASE